MSWRDHEMCHDDLSKGLIKNAWWSLNIRTLIIWSLFKIHYYTRYLCVSFTLWGGSNGLHIFEIKALTCFYEGHLSLVNVSVFSLQWRHNDQNSVSNHQRLHCLLNRFFGHRSKKTSKLRVTGLCVRGIHRWPVNSPHKRPVTRKMLPFEDVIMFPSYHINI